MQVTIEVTAEDARRLQLAREKGMDVDALLRGFIARLPTEGGQRTLRGHGKYAQSPVSVDDFERESHAEAEHEAESEKR